MLRLYQRASGPGRPPRVRWALEEAGAEYEWIVMDDEEGRGEEHRRRHPLGRVPVLETDDGLLFESAAICLHVADLYPDADLIPAPGTYERGLVYQWASFAMTELEPAIVRSIVAGQQGESPKEDAHLAKVYDVVVQVLEGRANLVGDRFGIADVILGGVLQTARRYSLLPSSGRLHEYFETLDARPAKQRAYADQRPIGKNDAAMVASRWKAMSSQLSRSDLTD